MGKKVLNVPSCFFSSMLNSKTSDKEWEKLTTKQQICFARMSYWMSSKATFGNNPHCGSSKKSKPITVKKPALPAKKPRTLFESLKNGGGVDLYGPGTSSSSSTFQQEVDELESIPKNDNENYTIYYDDNTFNLEVDPNVDQIVDVEMLTLDVAQDG